MKKTFVVVFEEKSGPDTYWTGEATLFTSDINTAQQCYKSGADRKCRFFRSEDKEQWFRYRIEARFGLKPNGKGMYK